MKAIDKDKLMAEIATIDLTEREENGFNACVECIECMPAIEIPMWIPISSGNLPKNHTIVEVTVVRKDKSWNHVPYIRIAEWDDDLQDWLTIPYSVGKLCGERLSESDGGDATVTAWKPLPEPYEGGQNEA